MTAGRIRVPVPAETSGEDRLVGSLTFRHAAYLAVAAAGLAVMLLGHVSTVRLALGAVLAIIGLAGAMVRPYGEPFDRLAFSAIGYLIRRRGTRIVDEPVEPTEEPVEPVEAEKAPAVPPKPAESTERRSRINPVAVRPLLVALAVCGVAAIAATQLIDRPPTPPPPDPRVVVVQIPATSPDPWGEVDRDFDQWLNSFG